MPFHIGKAGLVLSVGVGLFIGLGTFTFHQGNGFSYMSDDPRACINCHIMQPQYDAWINSSHSRFATCNDCHTPHNFVGKYYVKAINGFNHSYAFTVGGFHEPIQITPMNARVLQGACISCHQNFVHNQLVVAGSTQADAVQCVTCHSDVGHAGR